MGEFFTILPPPQSVDTLDAWGSLDTLPYSLDSALWQTVGVYGLVVSEGGKSGGALRGASVTRGLACHGKATSTGAMQGAKVAYLAGEGAAKSGGELEATVIRGVGGRGEARSSGALAFIAIRALFDTEPATSGGDMLGVKVSYLSGDGHTATHGEMSANFIRSLVAGTAAKSGGVANVGRVLVVAGAGQAFSGEEAVVSFKGWDWNEKEKPSAPVWGQEMAEPKHWAHTEENAAEWAAQSVPAGGWTQKHGGMATWQ
jgi:hypothetical protein